MSGIAHAHKMTAIRGSSSRTGKAAEADLMVLIAKNPVTEGQDEEDTQRHLNVVKNKLTGWHGVVHCELEYQTARYTV